MKYQLIRIDPFRAARVAAAMYFLVGLAILPVLLIVYSLAPEAGRFGPRLRVLQLAGRAPWRLRNRTAPGPVRLMPAGIASRPRGPRAPSVDRLLLTALVLLLLAFLVVLLVKPGAVGRGGR